MNKKNKTDIRSVLLVSARSKSGNTAKINGQLAVCLMIMLHFVFLSMSIATSHAETDVGVDSAVDVGIMVVTNIDVNMPSIDDTEIRRLFLGKSRRLPNGDRAALAAHGPSTAFFNSRVLGQSDTAIARIWSKLKFSGRQAPPRTFDTVEAVVAYVKSTTNAIAYLPGDYRIGDVQVMAIIPGNTPPLP